MFQFRQFPAYTYEFSICSMDMTPCGFPHSEIHGSKVICTSPWLIAAYHVFRRLPVPRHSPCALFSLTVFSSVQILHLPTSRIKQNCRFLYNQSFLDVFTQSLFSFQGASAKGFSPKLGKMVGSSGLEPPTSRLSGARSNHLSYEPTLVEMRGFEPLTPCLQSRCSPS